MKKERKAEKFIPKPQYPGGPRKMSSFIYSNLKYPEEDLIIGTKGTVRIKIEIDFTGKVIGTQIMSGLTTSCNEEAKRIVRLLKFEFHHKLRKGKIRYYKTLNIKFNPPKKVSDPIPTQIKYEFIPSKKQETLKPKTKPSPQIIYTVNIK
jgi:protein TonB